MAELATFMQSSFCVIKQTHNLGLKNMPAGSMGGNNSPIRIWVLKRLIHFLGFCSGPWKVIWQNSLFTQSLDLRQKKFMIFTRIGAVSSAHWMLIPVAEARVDCLLIGWSVVWAFTRPVEVFWGMIVNTPPPSKKVHLCIVSVHVCDIKA